MDITVNTTVNYAIKNVRVTNMALAIFPTSGLAIMAPYVWLDDAGKEIRKGMNQYTEAQLAQAFQAQGQDFAPVAAVLKSLVPSKGTSPRCNISFVGNPTANKGWTEEDGEGKGKWCSEYLNAEQFAAAIAPLTVDQLKAMIQQFTAMALA